MDDHGPLKKIIGKIMRKNRQNCQFFVKKSSLEKDRLAIGGIQ